jgi:hypothetical protein
MVKTVVWNNGSGILIYWLMIKVFNFEQKVYKFSSEGGSSYEFKKGNCIRRPQ